MSKHIAQMLGASEQLTSKAIAKLEKLSGYTSEDNRLISEIKADLRTKVAQLGLDPYDTTPKELYHCLLSHFERDSGHFDFIINGNSSRANKSLTSLVNLIELADVPKDVWGLKRSVAKDLLRLQPPKKLMRSFSYRSVESMLKREDIDKLYAALASVESSPWLKSFYKKHANLSARDFEVRQAEFVVMTDGHHLASKRAVSTMASMGIVVLWEHGNFSATHRLGSFLAALTALESLRFHSFSLMAKQVRPDFGRELVKQLESGETAVADIEGLSVSWQTLYSYYGDLPRQLHPALGEPYLDSIAMHKQSPSKTLAALHPLFRWWENNEYLSAVTAGTPLSMNLADTAQNYASGKIFSRRSSHHLNKALWDELVGRYMRHRGVEDYILGLVDKKQGKLKTISSSVFVPDLQKEFQTA